MSRSKFTFDPIFYFDLETTGINKDRCGIWQLAYIIEEKGEILKKRNLFTKPMYPLFCGNCKEMFRWDTHPYGEWVNKSCPECGNGVLVDNIEPKAREIINHLTFRDIVNGPDVVTPPEAYNTLVADIKELTYEKWGKKYQQKLYPAGYNIDSFDCDFLMKWFKDVNPEYKLVIGGGKVLDIEFFEYFYRNTVIDVKHVFINTYRRLVKKGDLPLIENVKLETVSKFLEEYIKKPLVKQAAGCSTHYHDALYDVEITREVLLLCDEIERTGRLPGEAEDRYPA